MDDVADVDDAAPDRAAPAPEDDRRPGATTRALARAGIIVTVLFLRSRGPGLRPRRSSIAAAVPGSVGELDPFFAAFRIPDFLFQLVAAGALSSALIPVIAGLFAKDEDARAWRVVSTVTTLMLSALAVLAALVLLFAPAAGRPIITPGFDEAQLAQTTELTRVMVLAPLFLAAGAVATSVLNAKGTFGAAALAPLVYNLAIIVGRAAARAAVRRSSGLAIGVVLGAAGPPARPGAGPGAGSARGSGRGSTCATTQARARRSC